MEPEVRGPEKVDPSGLEDAAARLFEGLLQASRAGQKEADVEYGGARMTVVLPPLGEGDRGVVYRLRSHSLEVRHPHGPLCVKVAVA